MDLSIIIVNWNTGNILLNCIESIKKETLNINYEIIIYDNDSKDRSIGNVELKFPDITIIKGNENLGFSKANNEAIKLSRGKYLLLLNPDTIIKDNAIEAVFNFISSKKEKEYLVGCKLLNSDLTLQLSAAKFPSLQSYIMRNGSNIEMNSINSEVEWVMGAFMMLSKELYNSVGGLDEEYFMYSEDMDLCYKIWRSGGGVYFYNEANIVHLYNQSGSKKWNGKRDSELKKSTFKFINKNYNNKSKKFILKAIYTFKYMLKKFF